ncbi:MULTISPECIES: radical SAM protein [unclassified Providencia]|uniref:radical SAM protein n=1 Tax=unclassified Providencia TaxID=2633465 RepID=UPI00234BD09C|nr:MULTISPECIES: radical SAM protein [unclassified Providencia]
MQQLSFDYIRQIVSFWLKAGGSNKIELAALEPLLWRSGQMTLPNLVAALKELGAHVSLTTNGSLLSDFAHPLKEAGVDLVRLSWHSTHPETFHQITGQNSYHRFMKGLQSAVDVKLPLAINRVLLRGHCDDLDVQVAFVNKHRLRLKLLDLYWMPTFEREYERFYINPKDVLVGLVDKQLLTPAEQYNDDNASRKRMRYHTKQGGIVEYKLSIITSKYGDICKQCQKQKNCLEGFGDYLRVFPDETVSLCYMRPDMGRALSIEQFNELPEWLHQQNMQLKMPLRLVLSGQCNFNCGFPNSEQSWCLKQGRGFKFPQRRLFPKHTGTIHVQNT